MSQEGALGPAAEVLPLFSSQQALWSLEQLVPGTPLYNTAFRVVFTGSFSPDRLRAALTAVVARQAALRTVFRDSAEGPVQVVRARQAVECPLEDLSGLSGLSGSGLPPRQAIARERLSELRRAAMDLAVGPLFRFRLVRLEAGCHHLLAVVHHLAIDGRSVRELVEQLAACYRGEDLPAPRLGWRDLLARERAALADPETGRRGERFWRSFLGPDAAPCEAPADRPRPGGALLRAAELSHTLPSGLSREVRRLARARRTSPFRLLLAAFGLLLARLTGRRELILGMPVVRGEAPAQLLGMFVNTLPFAIKLEGNEPFSALLARVSSDLREVTRHQAVSAETLEALLRGRQPGRPAGPSSPSGGRSAYGVVFCQLFDYDREDAPGADPAIHTEVLVGREVTPFELTLYAGIGGGDTRLVVEYASEVFERPTIARWMEQLAVLLEAAVAAPETPLAELGLLREAERHQLLVEWNDTRVALPRRTLAELFAAKALEVPEAPAVVSGEGAVTYAELAARSRRLAALLSRLGVGAETPVGLCFDHCEDWVLGMLAALEAGGCYVPLAADHPRERLSWMAADCGLSLVLTRGAPGGRPGVAGRPAEAAPISLAGLPNAPGAQGISPRWLDLDRLEELEGGAARKDRVATSPAEDTAEARPRRVAEAGRDRDPARDLALGYVLYTSGSTGRPKGTAVPQRAIVRLALGGGYLSLAAGDRVAQVSNMGFDAATFEVWGALLNGATLVAIPREVLLSPWRFGEELRRRRIDTLFLTTALFHQLSREAPAALASLRDLLVGGEAIDASLVRRVLAAGAPARLLNVYGPTESTTFATWHRADAASAARARLPIGRPIKATRVLVCDPHRLEPVPLPLGALGELCIGGEGLARGYLGRPELTAERFVPMPAGLAGGAGSEVWAAPASGAPAGERLYRTGDLVRQLPSGEIEFLGRHDGQVKVRGFRVELEEVEAALASHPRVGAVVVAARGEAGERELVAYLVMARSVQRTTRTPEIPEISPTPEDPASPENGVVGTGRPAEPGTIETTPAAGSVGTGGAMSEGVEGVAGAAGERLSAELREHLRRRLPDYMLPSAFVLLDALPLTPHGKVDRRALPAPEVRHMPASGRVAARTGLESELVGIWEEALGGVEVGVHDDLFSLGGHSLAAGRILSRVRSLLGIELPLALLFEAPTVAGLARGVERALRREGDAPVADAGPARVPRRSDGGDRFPLSFAQRRLWFLDRLLPGQPRYNIPAVLHLRGRLAVGALAAALEEIVRRHESLRTRFVLAGSGDEPLQEVFQLAAGAAAPVLVRVDLGAVPRAAREREALRLQEREALRPFNLSSGSSADAAGSRSSGGLAPALSAAQSSGHSAPAALADYLLRATLLQLGAEESQLLLTLHHIAADGWSLGVLYHELATLYAALLAAGEGVSAPGAACSQDLAATAPGAACSRASTVAAETGAPLAPSRAESMASDQAGAAPGLGILPALEIQYADFAVWQRELLTEEALAGQLSYWKEQLEGELPLLELGGDSPPGLREPQLPGAAREEEPTEQAWRGGARALRLPPELCAALRELGRGRRATPAMTFLAGFHALLHRLSGEERVAVGMPVAGRGARSTEGLIGLFVNSLVLVGDLRGGPCFAECLDRVRSAALGAYAHQDLPFERLVAELNPERRLGRNPLHQVTFAWQDATPAAPRLAGLEVTPLTPPVRTARFDLELHLAPGSPSGGGLDGLCVFDAGLFDGVTIERLMGHYAALLEAAVAAPGRAVGELDLLRAGERHQLLAEWNDVWVELPRDRGLAELFARQAGERPDAVAVAGEEGELTYGGLAARARRLAGVLRRLGLGAEEVVGLSCDRTADWVVGMLAVLEAGGCYLPLEAGSPRERLRWMVAETRLSLLLARGGEKRDLSAWADLLNAAPEVRDCGRQVRVLDLAWLGAADPGLEGRCAETPGAPDRLAYVLYTSGSTGRPKGIGIPQRAVVRLARGGDPVLLGPGDRVAQSSNMTFDAATFEVWGALLNGATLVEVPREVLLSPWRLGHELGRRGVDTLFLTTALFHQLAREAPESLAPLRDLWVGGEALEGMPALELLRLPSPPRLINGYGPTESTTFATCHRVTPASAARRRVPIGRPVAETLVVVCDAHRLEPSLVPVGVAGELCIGGEGLARGYLARPELTAERFVPLPEEMAVLSRPGSSETSTQVPRRAGATGAAGGERLYRTGDLARRLPCGEIEYLGRRDGQLKLRGFRIELGEIEANLAAHPAVGAAVAMPVPEPAGARLAAFLVPAAGSCLEADLAGLRSWLAERLPAYMVPAELLPIAALPLTASGKLDRAALLAELHARRSAGAGLWDEARQGRGPRTPLEASLVAVWEEVLGRGPDQPVGIADDFFLLGGHSLLATRVVSRVRDRHGVELPLRALFDTPTVAGLAERVRALLESSPGGLAGEAPGTPREASAASASPPLEPIPVALSGFFPGRGLPAAPPAPLAPWAPLPPVAPLSSLEGGAAYPLSSGQRRLWFFDRLLPGSSFYNLSYALRLVGGLDLPALHLALAALVRRHGALRTTFDLVAGEPVQRVRPARSARAARAERCPAEQPAGAEEAAGAERWHSLPVVDLGSLPPPAGGEEARRLLAGEALRPFDLSSGPLWRTLLLRLSPDEHLLASSQHHIISDGWSVGILHRELGALYAREAPRSAPSGGALLPPLRVQYVDFALWQRDARHGPLLASQLAYWRRQLGDRPSPMHLPADRARPPVQSFRGAAQDASLPAGLVAELARLGRCEGATLSITLLAGFLALLCRTTGEERVLAGSPDAGRSHTELEGILGFFANTLVMTGDLAGNPPFLAFLRRVREMALAAYAHRELPFEKLVEALAPERDLSRNPLVQAVFAFQSEPLPPPSLPGLACELLSSEVSTTRFDLELHLRPAGPGVAGFWTYAADLFDAATIRRLAGRYPALLEAALATPAAPAGELPILAAAERHQLLREWNDTGRGGGEPEETTLLDLFRRQVAARPQATALEAEGLRLTYRELAGLSHQLALRLARLGVGPEVTVGALTGRAPEMAVTFLAVAEAGGVYLPLDPSLPPRRLAWMLGDAGAAVLVVAADRTPLLEGLLKEEGAPVPAHGPGAALQVVRLAPLARDREGGEAGAPAPAAPNWGPDWGTGGGRAPVDRLAYLFYTSGSTGAPKGVGVSHRSLSGLVEWNLRRHGFRPEDRASLMAAVGFDVSIWEFLPPLAAGASLHLVPEELRGDPRRLADWLARERITVAFLPTALVHAVLDREPPAGSALRLVVTGGEALLPLLRPLAFPLVNHYGPTENTVVATAAWVATGPRETSLPPIGRPLTGVRAVVAEAWGEPAPLGIAGELWLGGAGLARGYQGRPDLTAERFVPDPWSGEPGARMYRTGDQVRGRGDGRLEFLGRRDHQVKVRGHRIELGEIEAALLAHEAVGGAVVVAEPPGQAGQAAEANNGAAPGDGAAQARIIAYVVPRAGQAPPPSVPAPTSSTGGAGLAALIAELRRHLQEALPAYMLPAAIVRLEAFPLTPNGKVDRRALPSSEDARRPAEIPFVAPRTATERLVARIWQQVLGVARIGAGDPFFELGGNSLDMARAASLLEAELERPVPLLWLFRFPTVQALAGQLNDLDGRGGRSGRGERSAADGAAARPGQRGRPESAEAMRELGWEARERRDTRQRRRGERREHRF